MPNTKNYFAAWLHQKKFQTLLNKLQKMELFPAGKKWILITTYLIYLGRFP